MFEGLKTAPPVSAAAMFTLVPLMSAGFAWLLLRQIMTQRLALALSIGAVGALWVIFRADLSALLAFDLVDELIGFTAGLGIGAEGLPSIGALGLHNLEAANRFSLMETSPVGADVMHRWRRTSLSLRRWTFSTPLSSTHG